ncbi:hypothetical protein N7522_013732 [Penicillium canescens]|nr:hypothetical protein N7522_013732 [Penicillium canescens]
MPKERNCPYGFSLLGKDTTADMSEKHVGFCILYTPRDRRNTKKPALEKQASLREKEKKRGAWIVRQNLGKSRADIKSGANFLIGQTTLINAINLYFWNIPPK